MLLNDHLIQLCKKQDRKAQEVVYKYFYQDVFRIAVRYTKNEEDAKHVMNDSFLAVFTKMDQFEGDISNFHAWVKKIVVNKSLDYLRSSAFKYSTLPLEDFDHKLTVDNQQQSSELNIIKLVQNLPFTTSAVFNLFVMEGYNHKEISDILGITESNSKYHLHAARQKLKSMLFKSEIQ